MADKYCKLVMVTAENNNKYYIMEEKNGIIHIEYGRVDSTSTKLTKPASKWNSIYNEKTKKGYKDVTDFVTEKQVVDDKITKTVTMSAIQDTKVDVFLNLMRKYTDGLVSNTYTVTYKNVTESQIKEAQSILDTLKVFDAKKDEKKINEKLIELYTLIPRKMSKVQYYLLPSINFEKSLEQEQDNLDAMESQVKMYASKPNKEEDVPQQQTFLDVLGIKMVTSTTNPDIEYLIKQIKTNNRNKIEAIFDIVHPREDKRFNEWMNNQKNKQTRTLIHGTRCSSVVPIIKTSLQIRPSGNFQFSGKVYGNGNYFSETVIKSLGYTGYDPDKILLVYEVHVGNAFTYDGWYRGNSFTLSYPELQKRGFDSTFVKAGNGLLNSEIIAYKEEQCRLKHIIWLK